MSVVQRCDLKINELLTQIHLEEKRRMGWHYNLCMPLSKILENISQKGKIPERNRSKEFAERTTSGNVQSSLRTEKNGDKKQDPVVSKLKASRKEEVDKLKNLKNLTSKSDYGTLLVSDRGKKDGIYEKNNQSRVPSNVGDDASKRPGRKLKYNELMKKASKIDKDKLQISTLKKSKSPNSQQMEQRNQNLLSRMNPTHTSLGERTRKVPNKENSAALRRTNQDLEKQKLPTRQPSQKLQQKLKELRKSQSPLEKTTGRTVNNSYYEEEEEEEDDSDSFIASDEEEEIRGKETDPGYDRDEIWALFNRGKKRSYFEKNDLDYDSADDMEATGSEVLREEMRSKKNAELEDLKELEEEKRLAALKRAKKLNKKV